MRQIEWAMWANEQALISAVGKAISLFFGLSGDVMFVSIQFSCQTQNKLTSDDIPISNGEIFLDLPVYSLE